MKIAMCLLAGLLLGLQTTFAADVVWVDTVNGNDSYKGDDLGSQEHPYKTIQMAVYGVDDGGTVKVLAPCDYKTGSTGSSRVYINKPIHLLAVGEPGTAKITGDASTRCVVVKNGGAGTVIEGFTLTGGALSSAAGSAVSSDVTSYLVDCVVTNCTAGSTGDGCAVYSARAVRCRFVDCTGNYILEYGGAFGCLFERCEAVTGIFRCSSVVQCTVGNCKGKYVMSNINASRGKMNNTVATEMAYESAMPFQPSDAGGNAFTTGSGLCVNAANGDFRLLPGSSAVSCADAAAIDAAIDLTLGVVPISRTDLCGRTLPTTGMIHAGCFQQVRPTVRMTNATYGGVSLNGQTADVAIDEDQVVTIAPASGCRPCCGVKTNGVEVLFVDFPDGIPVAMTAWGADVSVAPIYGTDWYVNAVSGDDAKDGFTPATAKKTLASVCTNEYVLSGDTIHAAPGVYKDGVCPPPGSNRSVGSRAYLKSGVSLIAEGSVSETVIEGADPVGAHDEQPAETGAGAVRGVYLALDTLVKGFTIRNGRARGYSVGGSATDIDVEYGGGGVCGANNEAAKHSRSIVENCILTNNAAGWGGGARGVLLRGCYVNDNDARTGQATLHCSHESTFINNHSGTYMVRYPYALVNTTIGNGTAAADNTPVFYYPYVTPTNCLFACKTGDSDVLLKSHECLFTHGYSAGLESKMPAGHTSLFVQNLAALGLDEDFKPTKSSPAVDFCTSSAMLKGTVDASLGQRVYNGKVDCGAYEYDWRPDYRVALGNSKLKVIAAAPNVRLEDGKVRLSNGSDLAVHWERLLPDARRHVTFAISDSGQLAISANGAEPVLLDSTQTEFSYDGDGTEDVVTFAFAGNGFADLGKLSCSGGLMILLR